VANGVHSPVNGVQPPPPHPPINRVRAQPKRYELRASDHSVLPPRQIRDRSVEGVRRILTAHYAVK
jgi:hypothetical protein